jgi:hypothetical protein
MIIFAFKSFNKPWRKALFLDMFLYEVHKTLFTKKKPDFSTLFLNAGAHIQHHYYFNSPFTASHGIQNPSWYISKNEDPMLEMLYVYNDIINDLLSWSNIDFLVATGLSQKPHNEIKFYYRLNNHEKFLHSLDIDFAYVAPRMTRDFLISFDSEHQAEIASKKLSEILVDGKVKLFEEIDNRGKDIFIMLTYSSEITSETTMTFRSKKFCLRDLVSFVAVKNGEHHPKGFAFFSKGISNVAPHNNSHVSNLHESILKYFHNNLNSDVIKKFKT